jgi:hypothetical protein
MAFFIVPDAKRPFFLTRQLPRAQTRVAGYNCVICLEQTTNAAGEQSVVLWMDYLTAVDLKMSIPKFLVNWAATSGVKSVITSFHDAFDKYPAYKASAKAK